VTRPPLFQSATFDDVMAQARAGGTWLIVSVTSASSESAQMMDRATWQNTRLLEWFDSGALAVQIDVDAQPELAATLKVDSAPAVIAFKNGAEKDRIAGFVDSTRLLMWLMSLDHEHKTAYDKAIRKGGGDFERDMQGRLSFAKQLLQDEEYAKAAEHYVWLWHNIERVDPDMSGVRVSFMAGEIKKLVTAFPPARESFTAIRDEAGAAADAVPTSTDKRLDWIVLNNILDDEQSTLAWYDGIKTDPLAEPIVRGVGRFLIDLLKARGRWADVGRLYKNPLKELAFHHELVAHSDLPMMAELLPKEAFDQVKEVMNAQFHKAAAELYASLRAAGRTADAKAVHEEALRLDPSEEMKRALDESPVRYD
jgi:hypothetical protein